MCRYQEHLTLPVEPITTHSRQSAANRIPGPPQIPSTNGFEDDDMTTIVPGGALTLAEGLTLSRMGYGAMQLTGPHVFGPLVTVSRPWPYSARRSPWASGTSTPATSTAQWWSTS
ncbi:hypothetical protein GCM10027614_41980 [Micromonospora vulcania]